MHNGALKKYLFRNAIVAGGQTVMRRMNAMTNTTMMTNTNKTTKIFIPLLHEDS